MVPRPMAPARAMRSRTCADVIQPCFVFLDFFSRGCLPESFDLVHWTQFSNSLVKHISNVVYCPTRQFHPRSAVSRRDRDRGIGKSVPH